MKKQILLTLSIIIIALLVTGCPGTTGGEDSENITQPDDNNGNDNSGDNNENGATGDVSQAIETANDSIDAILTGKGINVSGATGVYMNYIRGFEGPNEGDLFGVTKLYVQPDGSMVSVMTGMLSGTQRVLNKSTVHNNTLSSEAIETWTYEEISHGEVTKYPSGTVDTTGYTFYKKNIQSSVRGINDYLQTSYDKTWSESTDEEIVLLKQTDDEIIEIGLGNNSSPYYIPGNTADTYKKNLLLPSGTINTSVLNEKTQAILTSKGINLQDTTVYSIPDRPGYSEGIITSTRGRVYVDSTDTIHILGIVINDGSCISTSDSIVEVTYNGDIEYLALDTLTTTNETVTLLYDDDTEILKSEYEGYTLYKGSTNEDGDTYYYLIKTTETSIIVARFYSPLSSEPTKLELSDTVQYQKQ